VLLDIGVLRPTHAARRLRATGAFNASPLARMSQAVRLRGAMTLSAGGMKDKPSWKHGVALIQSCLIPIFAVERTEE